MELRTRILIVGSSILVTLVVVGSAVWWWSWRLSRQEGGASQGQATGSTLLSPVTTLPDAAGRPPSATRPVPKLSPEEELKSDLSSIAFSFAERFGSYSNQGSFDNINTLRFLMTRGMNTWADAYITKLTTEPQPAGELYYGVATTTLATAIESFDLTSGRITMLVTTQRKETRGALANSTLILQTLRLTFLNEEGTWKVDSALWGAKERIDRN